MMQPFTVLKAAAAPLPQEDIDTDVIFPARFLLLMNREGLGRYAFHDRRFDSEGAEKPDFVLNQPRFRQAGILVTGANFGCGSSREQAVWALLGFGIRCVIAPSFGEIFAANCAKNGVLAMVLPANTVANLLAQALESDQFVVDLAAMTLTAAHSTIAFRADAGERLALLNGWDETETILKTEADAIGRFEARQAGMQPWLYPEGVPA